MEQNNFVLTKENYFSREASRLYMGSTQYKDFLDCEAKAVAKNKGLWVDEEKDTFLIGKAVHAWNEGTFERFMDEHKDEMYSKKGELYAKFQIIHTIIDSLKKDKNMIMALEGKKEVMFTAEMFGIKWKIMIDSYRPENGVFTDLKNMRSLIEKYWIEGQDGEKGHWGGFIEKYNYIAQMAIYAEVERIATEREERLQPMIAAISKEEYPDKKVIMFKDEDLQEELEKIEHNIKRVAKVWKGEEEPVMCGKCDYCKSIKDADIVLYDKNNWKMEDKLI